MWWTPWLWSFLIGPTLPQPSSGRVAETGRRPARRRRRPRQRRGELDRANAADLVYDIEPEPRGERERLRHVEHRACGNSRGEEALRPLRARARGELPLDRLAQLRRMPNARRVVREPRVGGESLRADRAAEARELALVADADHQVAVRGAVGREGRDARMVVAEPRGHVAGREIARRLVRECRQSRVHEVDRDALAAAARLALAQRREHADRRLQARDDIDDRDARLRRCLRRPRHGHQSAERLDERVVPRHVPPAGLSEAGDLAVDDARVRVDHTRVVEAEPFERPGAEVRDDDVCAVAQIACGGAVGGAAQVEHERALVAVRRVEVRRAAALVERRPPPARIVSLRRLDLDDVRPEVAQRLADQRPREHAREVGHEEAVERGGHLPQAGTRPARISESTARSMLPPDTMQTTFPSPASPATAAATASAPAPSATTRARSARSRIAAAMSGSGAAHAESRSCDACSHTRGISARLPEPSTNETRYSTAVSSPAARVALTGAPVSGSTAITLACGRSALTTLAIPVRRPPPP